MPPRLTFFLSSRYSWPSQSSGLPPSSSSVFPSTPGIHPDHPLLHSPLTTPPPSLKTTWLLCPGGRGCWNAGLPLASAWGKGARGWIFGCLWKALSLQGPRMVSQAFHSRSERWVLQQNCDWGNKWWVSFFITFLNSSLSFK